MWQISELLEGNSVIAAVLVRRWNPTRGFKSSSEHLLGKVLLWVSHCWHLCHSMALLVCILWKLPLRLPLITIIKLKWCLLCGKFSVPDRMTLLNNSFSRAPSAGQFSEGTVSACFYLQVGFAAKKDAQGQFWSRDKYHFYAWSSFS